MSPEKVASHSFYPFIEHTIVTEKIRKVKGRGVEKRTKRRLISYAAHKDSHIFTFYSDVLMSHYEEAVRAAGIVQCPIAFRSMEGRNTIHFANEVFEYIKQTGPCAALAMDLSDFFGQLDHKILMRTWRGLLNVERLADDQFAVLKAITRYSKVDRDELYKVLGIDSDDRRESRHRLCSPKQFRDVVRGRKLCITNKSGKGIPQGSPISAVLSNLYMLEFDKEVSTFVTDHGGLYRRYCDDILVVLPTGKQRTQVKDLICGLCESLKLPINPDKTEEIDFGMVRNRLNTPKPLQYLGFTFDGVHKRIRPGSVARYYKKMRAGVRRAKAIRERSDQQRGLTVTTWLKRKKLYRLYSYLGRRNFVSYAFKAARIMNDAGIKKQVRNHWKRLQAAIAD